MISRRLRCCILVLAIVGPGQATQRPGAKDAARFVEAFYRWYPERARIHGVPGALKSALDEKKAVFSKDLRRALSDDVDAQEKVDDQIVGLDFDPFLNGQDEPAERYVASQVSYSGGVFRVHVDDIDKGVIQRAPAVIADVATVSGKLVFVNFEYPQSGSPPSDLLHVLDTLRRSRQRPR